MLRYYGLARKRKGRHQCARAQPAAPTRTSSVNSDISVTSGCSTCTCAPNNRGSKPLELECILWNRILTIPKLGGRTDGLERNFWSQFITTKLGYEPKVLERIVGNHLLPRTLLARHSRFDARGLRPIPPTPVFVCVVVGFVHCCDFRARVIMCRSRRSRRSSSSSNSKSTSDTFGSPWGSKQGQLRGNGRVLPRLEPTRGTANSGVIPVCV